ncbi:hypothetical protein ACSBR2_021864 [Camellia fascicularis]
MDDEFEKGMGSKKFPYHELAHATKNFTDDEKLGEGGFGGVYRGFLRDWNSYVAIKRVLRESRQGIKEYASEVKIISRLRHRNLVQLLGWCHEKGELLLVYEFMPNGSLDSLLFKEENVLSWSVRYQIAQGLASALLYLHEAWEQCVMHRDVKSSNVMLDSSFNARLGDFGLARLVDHGKVPQTTDLARTMGYMAPECVTTGKASRESDVYSFGIVALEIACGRKPIDPNAKERSDSAGGVGLGTLWINPLHATALSFNLTNIGPQLNAEIVAEGDAYVSPEGIQLTTNEMNMSQSKPHTNILFSFGTNTFVKLTDFNTYFTFVNDSKGSNVYGDGITFFLVPNGSTPNITAVERILSFLVDLREYLPEWVAIGFSASTKMNFEKNTVKSWTFNSTLQIDVPVKPGPSPGPNTVIPSPPKKMGENNKKALVVALTAVSLVLIGIGPKKFTYGELFHATDNFAEEHKLGEGGFGGVYRGFLRESNSYVAVKRISKGSKQGIKEYASEVKIITQLRHRNLVQLIGWCHDKRELLLVYEFMENKILDYHLFKEKSPLTWATRDVKSSNVMLDTNFNAKLGDFGLANLLTTKKGHRRQFWQGPWAIWHPNA